MRKKIINIGVVVFAVLLTGLVAFALPQQPPMGPNGGPDMNGSTPPANQSTPYVWPERPAGKKFRIWTVPLTKNTQLPGANVGEYIDGTDKGVSVYWQTGKGLPHCVENGIGVVIPFPDPNLMGGNSTFPADVWAAPSGNDPCTSYDKVFPVKTVFPNAPGRNTSMKSLIQVAVPVFKFPSGNQKAKITWQFSDPITVDVNTLDGIKCFGPSPCPTDIPHDYNGSGGGWSSQQ